MFSTKSRLQHLKDEREKRNNMRPAYPKSCNITLYSYCRFMVDLEINMTYKDVSTVYEMIQPFLGN